MQVSGTIAAPSQRRRKTLSAPDRSHFPGPPGSFA